jgi:tetratricopeptide (TPR) repeat protein
MIRMILSEMLIGAVAMVVASDSAAQLQSVYASAQFQADWYGNGVHQYFNGEFADAIASFSTAISANPNDPRPYYYRGLARLNCDTGAAATADFQLGAIREAYKSRGASSAVNRSLERIQGPCRLEIERYRREARLAVQMYNTAPAANSPPVLFGDMVDVDSITPIIQHVIPPVEIDAPGPAMEPPPAADQSGQPNQGPDKLAPPLPPANPNNDPFGG